MLIGNVKECTYSLSWYCACRGLDTFAGGWHYKESLGGAGSLACHGLPLPQPVKMPHCGLERLLPCGDLARQVTCPGQGERLNRAILSSNERSDDNWGDQSPS